MEYAKRATAALAHVDDSYYTGAYCGKRKHLARLSLKKLRAHQGDSFPLRDLRERLRCERCGSSKSRRDFSLDFRILSAYLQR
jgi:hypothetical protein